MMLTINMQLEKIKCEKCGHERIPRTEHPIKCPVCGHIPGTKIKVPKEVTS
jgi:ribosomal protein S27E